MGMGDMKPLCILSMSILLLVQTTPPGGIRTWKHLNGDTDELLDSLPPHRV